MPDYKEMYLELARSVEKAIHILIDAQHRCEDMYFESEDPDLKKKYPK